VLQCLKKRLARGHEKTRKNKNFCGVFQLNFSLSGKVKFVPKGTSEIAYGNEIVPCGTVAD